MCEPVSTTLAITSAVMSAGGAVAQYEAQRRAANQSRRNAGEALRLQRSDLNTRFLEEAEAASDSVRRIQRQVQAAQGQTLALAGSAGVTGNSVTSSLNAILADAGESTSAIERNLDIAEQQLARQQEGATATARNRAEQIAPPSLFVPALQIGGAALGVADRIQNTRPIPGARR